MHTISLRTFEDDDKYHKKGRGTNFNKYLLIVVLVLVALILWLWIYDKKNNTVCIAGDFNSELVSKKAFNPEHPDYSLTPVSTLRSKMSYKPVFTNKLKPVVTVVVYIYNSFTLHQTIESIYGQTLQNFEIIIVDDGTNYESSLKALKKYEQEVLNQNTPQYNGRVRIIQSKEHKGRSYGYNIAWKNARSDLLFFLDAGNLIEPTTLEILAWYLSSHSQYGFAKGYSVIFDQKNVLHMGSFSNRESFLDVNQVTTSAMIKLSVLKKVHGFDIQKKGREAFDGWDFWLKCAENGVWGSTVNDFLDWQRLNEKIANYYIGLEDEDFPLQSGYDSVLTEKYPGIFSGKWPRMYKEDRVNKANHAHRHGVLNPSPPFKNSIAKDSQHLLFILKDFELQSRMGKDNLEMLRQLISRGWTVTVVAMSSSFSFETISKFRNYTSDCLSLSHFIPPQDFPRFLRYLIESRNPNVIFISGSEIGYQLLPFMRAVSEKLEVTPAFISYVHIDQILHNHHRDASQSMLDITLVSTTQQLLTLKKGDKNIPVELIPPGINSIDLKRDNNVRDVIRETLNIEKSEIVLLITEYSPNSVMGDILRFLDAKLIPFKAIIFPLVPESWEGANNNVLSFYVGDDLNGVGSIGGNEGWMEYIDFYQLYETVIVLANQTFPFSLKKVGVKEILSSVDILAVSPGGGLSLVLDAMSAGVLVVGTKTENGLSEYITNFYTGVLVDIKMNENSNNNKNNNKNNKNEGEDEDEDSDEMELDFVDLENIILEYSKALEDLIKHPDLIQRISSNAKNFVNSRFNENDMGEKLVESICQGVKNHHSDPKASITIEIGMEGAARGIEFSMLQSKTQTLKEKITQMGGEIRQLKSDLEEWKGTADELNSAVYEKEERIYNLESLLKDENNQIEKCSSSFDILKERVDKRENELSGCSERLQKCENLNEENESMKASLNLIVSELEECKRAQQ